MTQIIDKPANELARVAQQVGLAESDFEILKAAFSPYFENAEKALSKAGAIEVTDATQVTEIRLARALRLELRTIRTSAENTRKQLKENSLRTGKAIDGMCNVIKFMVEPVEQKLLDMELFAVRKEAERKAGIKSDREDQIRHLGIDPAMYQVGEINESAFLQLIKYLQAAKAAREAAAAKAEADRIEAARIKAEEDRRIREENTRLKVEAEAREKAANSERDKLAAQARAAAEKARKERESIELKAKKEREAIEAKADTERKEADAALLKERKAREAIEAEVKAKREVEARKAAVEAKAKKMAALAPDKDKLMVLADVVRRIKIPTVESDEAESAIHDIKKSIASLVKQIEQYAGELE